MRETRARLHRSGTLLTCVMTRTTSSKGDVGIERDSAGAENKIAGITKKERHVAQTQVGLLRSTVAIALRQPIEKT